MANVHVYMGIENLNMSAAQRGQLIDALRALGAAKSSSQPGERNHWRTRLDNDAVIFEALFNEGNVSIAGIKSQLAAVFSVDVSQVSHATQQNAYGMVVTYTYNSTNYLRMIAFGYSGGWPVWSVSGDAARAFLIANAAEWEPAA